MALDTPVPQFTMRINAGAIGQGQSLFSFESNNAATNLAGLASAGQMVVPLWNGSAPGLGAQKNLYLTDIAVSADLVNTTPVLFSLVAANPTAFTYSSGQLSAYQVLYEEFVSVTSSIGETFESQECVPYGSNLYAMFTNTNAGTLPAAVHISYGVNGSLQ